MGKVVFIAEKPSVAQQFAQALDLKFARKDGYLEAQNTIVTWCFGHLVTMSYPEAYDPKLKRWSLDTIPFIPEKFRYEVIREGAAKKQFQTVKGILTSPEVDTIYICTDSGREGEYIYRLVAEKAGVKGKKQLRVWINSQTKEEVLRGIREAKDDSEYDDLGAAAYLRAMEDYLMGINFSRALSLKYAREIQDFLHMDRCVIAVGRVMTCVLGIIVRREREIRAFVKTPFYRVTGRFGVQDGASFEADWTVQDHSLFDHSPKLYSEKGFRAKEDAKALIGYLKGELTAAKALGVPRGAEGAMKEAGAGCGDSGDVPVVLSISHRKEVKNPPLLYNLAELQNDCSRFLKISPDETLNAAQELYEKKLTTYPRTDARVLSSAVAAEIGKNLGGISSMPMFRPLTEEILKSGSYKKIGKTKYTNDKAITDHYAIIPTGQGLSAIPQLSPTYRKVYEMIVRRFLSVFFPAAVYDRMQLKIGLRTEVFAASLRVLKEEGYLACTSFSFFQKKDGTPSRGGEEASGAADENAGQTQDAKTQAHLAAVFALLKKGMKLSLEDLQIREGAASPPKRYNSGDMILTMENAGQFIEDEELREQIRGSGIGTSATRADILKKLVDNQYIDINKKTQIYTPTQLGEMIYDTVYCSIRPLLDPRLTASWEKGLTGVAGGEIPESEYFGKLKSYVTRRTDAVKASDFRAPLRDRFREDAQYYPKPMHFKAKYTYAKKGKK